MVSDDVSDDWIPIYDQSSLPGYYMAIGTSGNQVCPFPQSFWPEPRRTQWPR